MKNILIGILIIAAGAGAYYFARSRGQLEPLYPPPYVAIYGRDVCGYTQKYRQDISALHMRSYSKDIDDPATADVLHSRMEKAGLDTSRYELPVLDVNGKIFIRPPMDQVVKAYQESVAKKSGIKKPKIKKRDPGFFKNKLVLEGVSLGDPAMAVINGEVVGVGDEVAGCKIVEIEEFSVRLKDSQGKDIMISLGGQAGAAPKTSPPKPAPQAARDATTLDSFLAQLPPPPDGLEWFKMEEIKAAFLAPKGWHVKHQDLGDKKIWAVSKENVDEQGGFQTGLTFISFQNVATQPQGRVLPSQFAKAMADETQSRYKLERREHGPKGPFWGCLYQYVEDSPGREPVRIFHSLVANDRTGTLYQIIFEAPVAAWEAEWPVGDLITKNIVLDDEI
ncbi:MAG TPA: hypothetical protein PLT76_04765 [Candidatus Omnitrophota bacterium]|nr:hypothetical protein [Candidatus Omnitrophota bacterium]HQO58012.1 hypothetical protein [Candidatus Omnitrophota bacterium]